MGPAAVAAIFRASLLHAAAIGRPFRHWLLRGALPGTTIAAIEALPIAPPRIEDTAGKRETNNATRSYFAGEILSHGACRDVAQAFHDRATVEALERLCEVSLSGGRLRIEYCQDTEGFWLEPHTDIGAKLLTLIIYLSESDAFSDWGTDIYEADGTLAARAPFGPGRGLLFVPGSDTWHGFAPRPIKGIRRSLIVNYVKNEWRARQELAFPDSPVG